MDQKIALQNIDPEFTQQAVIKTAKHKYWGVRSLAIASAIKNQVFDKQTEELIAELAKNDKKTKVQSSAIDYLAQSPNNEKYEELFELSVNNLSYAISGASLNALSLIDSEKSILLADSLLTTAKNEQKTSIKSIYAKYGGPEKLAYFTNLLSIENNYSLYRTSGLYIDYLKNQDLNTTIEGMDALETLYSNATSWMVWFSERLMQEMKSHFEEELKNQNDKAIKSQIKQQIDRINTLLLK
jgi:aminopeptidase N